MGIEKTKTINQAIALYVHGKSVADIANELHIPSSTIFWALRKANVPTRNGKPHLNKEQQEQIIHLFQSGRSRKDIAKIFGCHISSVISILCKYGFIGATYVSDKKSNEIAKMYIAGESLNQISKKLHISTTTVFNHCKKHNIITKTIGNRFELTHPNFFEILTAESAYFLGFFIADGCLMSRTGRNGTFSFGVNISDAYMVEIFQKSLGAPHKISINKGIARITITNEKVYKSLVAFGIPEKRKTYNLGDCSNLFCKLTNSNYARDFIRGFMDGDGCIFFNEKRGSHYVSFTAFSKSFLISIESLIRKRLNIEGKYVLQNNKYWRLNYYRKPVIEKLLGWIYNPEPTLQLSRKRQKWEYIKADYKYYKKKIRPPLSSLISH